VPSPRRSRSPGEPSSCSILAGWLTSGSNRSHFLTVSLLDINKMLTSLVLQADDVQETMEQPEVLSSTLFPVMLFTVPRALCSLVSVQFCFPFHCCSFRTSIRAWLRSTTMRSWTLGTKRLSTSSRSPSLSSRSRHTVTQLFWLCGFFACPP
jgi:hypothetical protein